MIVLKDLNSFIAFTKSIFNVFLIHSITSLFVDLMMRNV